MSRVIYYTAVSLDGFVADSAGSLDWLLRHEGDPDGLLGWNHFDASVGAMVMGRTTYDWLLDGPLAAPDAAWPHRQPCWVRTRRPGARVLPGADVRFTADAAETVIAQMRQAAGSKDVWCVGGGATATWLLEAGLLDEVWVTIAPEVLGAGTPLLGGPASLRLEDVGRNGEFAACRYTVLPSRTQPPTLSTRRGETAAAPSSDGADAGRVES